MRHRSQVFVQTLLVTGKSVKTKLWHTSSNPSEKYDIFNPVT
jgi:hypothetical protein